MAAHFTPETLRFLRGLSRHNDRAWFEERRPTYERALRDPLHATIDTVNAAMADWAPEFVRPPHKIAMRIYRDTRFSPDKRPYKTNIAAWWSQQGLEKTSAAGFFFQVGPTEGLVAAGIYAPERTELLLVRNWIAEHHQRVRDTLDKVRRPKPPQPALELLEPNALTRNPKGFATDHPAEDLLRARNWGVILKFSSEQALASSFPSFLAEHFRRMAPVVSLLNEPFLQRVFQEGNQARFK